MSAVLNQERKRGGRASRPPQRRPVLSPAESRMLIGVAFRVPGVLVAIIATVVLVTLVSVNSELTGTFGAIAGLWFAVHQVPLSIAGTSLGVFPLLPTLVMGVVVARGIARVSATTATRRESLWIFAAAVLGPLVVTALALAVAADASAAIGLSSPHALLAFAWVGGVHALSAALGIALGSWDSGPVVERVPEWVRAVVAPTVKAVATLVAGGTAIVLAAMVASWSTMEMLLDAGNGFVGVLGLTVLSILYLPNVILGALAVAVGSSAHVGEVSVSLFHTVGGPVPPLPVLAVLPEGAAQSLWMVMLVVPIAAGLVLGRDCARRTVDVHYALSSVWLVSAVVGAGALLLGYAAGGNLGTFGTVQLTVWSFGLLVFAWLAVVGSVGAAITAWRGGSTQPPVDETPEAPEVPPVAVAAVGQGVVHPERAVDAELVEEPAMVESTPDAVSNDEEAVVEEVEVVEALVEPPVDAASTGENPAEDIVEAEIVEEPSSETVVPDEDSKV